MAQNTPTNDDPDGPAESADGADATVDDAARCYCPLGGVMDLLSAKYAIQVVCVVGALQPVRYGEIESAFGDVSSSTLSTRLDDLQEAGLLDRVRRDPAARRVPAHRRRRGTARPAGTAARVGRVAVGVRSAGRGTSRELHPSGVIRSRRPVRS